MFIICHENESESQGAGDEMVDYILFVTSIECFRSR